MTGELTTVETWPLRYGLEATVLVGLDDRSDLTTPTRARTRHDPGCKCDRCLRLYGTNGRPVPDSAALRPPATEN